MADDFQRHIDENSDGHQWSRTSIGTIIIITIIKMLASNSVNGKNFKNAKYTEKKGVFRHNNSLRLDSVNHYRCYLLFTVSGMI